MHLSDLKRMLFEAKRPVLVSLGWGVCLSAATVWAIFQGTVLPVESGQPIQNWMEYHLGPLSSLNIFYLIFFSLCILCATMVQDFGKSLVAYLVAYIVAAMITFEFMSAPGLFGTDQTFKNLLAKGTLSWTFTALFPAPLFTGMLGTIIGGILYEKYFS